MPSPKNDRAFAESMRSEQHPDRKHPNIAEIVDFHRALVIGCNQGHDLQADLLTPAELPREPRPAIVFLHGGSWLAGGPSQFHFHANRIATATASTPSASTTGSAAKPLSQPVSTIFASRSPTSFEFPDDLQGR